MLCFLLLISPRVVVFCQNPLELWFYITAPKLVYLCNFLKNKILYDIFQDVTTGLNTCFEQSTVAICYYLHIQWDGESFTIHLICTRRFRTMHA